MQVDWQSVINGGREIRIRHRETLRVRNRDKRHVAEALPRARHLELECGHVPQIELPRQAHEAVRSFFDRRMAAGGLARALSNK